MKGKSVRFFHLLIFSSDMLQASGGRAAEGTKGGMEPPSTEAASPNLSQPHPLPPAPPRTRSGTLCSLCSQLSSLHLCLSPSLHLPSSSPQCPQSLPGWKHIIVPPLKLGNKAYRAEWDLGLWSGPKGPSGSIICL